MGYETALLIGRSTRLIGDEYAKEPAELDDDGSIYFPRATDKHGKSIKTGRISTWFQIYATVDLCKCGNNSHMHDLDSQNKDPKNIWYWYYREGGNVQETEDCYGVRLKPVAISEVIEALENDSSEDSYRRFKWALALLKSMEDDPEGLEVLIYGH